MAYMGQLAMLCALNASHLCCSCAQTFSSYNTETRLLDGLLFVTSVVPIYTLLVWYSGADLLRFLASYSSQLGVLSI